MPSEKLKNTKKEQFDSIVLQIDLAENYMCKFHNEIQAVHFRNSHQ